MGHKQILIEKLLGKTKRFFVFFFSFPFSSIFSSDSKQKIIINN
jgi:hypothetical protein